MISTEALNQFKTIMLDDYGVALDDNEAIGLAEDYLAALEVVLAPPIMLPKDHYLTKPLEKRQNDD